ncbi:MULTISPECIES: PTS sugar transporter subunit IIB [Frigoribacterium]|uniref:PTS sugar transporter subunit IIB n=1 Tax=Frigoribacterium TaxID=96492 RepID=UPI00141F8A43|nr:PTS sugar transporter subunit IIB [Frigoribacterium sp. NBH87]MBD8727263.1 PTS sugar transporter subunit IIB [Frigoribacterium sp. CFBP 13707]NII50146.1 PTS system ascorbate-specific IIB component [Frigoribacterium endophyticum]QNE44774.1 PTS sugar transporter subunit IIB [Frigoribacterium sp. NBH87]
MKIVTICGVGIGSSGILKVNAERVLAKLDIEADVVAADIGSLAGVADDAQVILTSAEFVEAIGQTFADVIVIQNHFDQQELTEKLQRSLG